MSSPDERLRRWRLALGGGEADGTAHPLEPGDLALDRALGALYDSDRRGNLHSSAPSVPRWLGDIRRLFPQQVVQIMQRDAIERLDMKRLLLEPEILRAVEPDVHLVATLVGLRPAMSSRTLESAREVVRRVVEQLQARLSEPLRQAVTGALSRSVRNLRPSYREMDWQRTIRANLRHYQPEYRTIVPERRIGFGRRRASLKEVVLCVDQSGSMASSVVYASICGAVLASVPALSTRLVVFDTAVVDLTDQLSDPVEVLFSTQLGGGTDINRAVAYCQSRITRPSDTILVLISDLFEGGVEAELRRRIAELVAAGVRVIVLLALSDDGAPASNHQLGAELASLGAPAFACTPDLFPELMSAALAGRDVEQWAALSGLVTERATEHGAEGAEP